MELRVRLGTPQARPGFPWVEVGLGSWLVVGAGAVMSPALFSVLVVAPPQQPATALQTTLP